MSIRKFAVIAACSTLALGVPPALAQQITNASIEGSIIATPGGNPSASACVTQMQSVDILTYGFVGFTLPTSTALNAVTTLTAVYSFPAGSYAGGSPRVDIYTTAGTVRVYLGTPPAFTDAGHASFVSSGNLVASGAELRWDTSGVGGTFYDTYANAMTLAGTATITGVQFTIDGGWSVPQTAQLDTLTVNTYFYQTACPVVQQVSVPVPTTGEWTLAAIALMLGALGLAARRKRGA